MNNIRNSSNSGSIDGSIINNTNSKVHLLDGLGRYYFREFLDDDYHCHCGKVYGFEHIVLPKHLFRLRSITYK